jgi:hypothetical protein
MIAVCSEILRDFNAALAEQWDAYVKLARERTQLRKQLAAEREKVQPLVDALKSIRVKCRDGYTVSSSVVMFLIEDAFAKVKGS